MEVTSCTTHVKKHAKHQMMITKLQTYNDVTYAKYRSSDLDVLKRNCEERNWFFGSIKIPKFEYVIKENKILIQSEFMFGVQLNQVDIPDHQSTIYNELVNIDNIEELYGFKDLTLDNFIIRSDDGKQLDNNEPYWNFAYVDHEGFTKCTKKDKKKKFEEQIKRWIL